MTKKLDLDTIKDLYINKKKSAFEIGLILGVSINVIIKRLKKMNIKIKSFSEIRKGRHFSPETEFKKGMESMNKGKFKPINHIKLKDLYTYQGKSARKIAKIFNVAPDTIIGNLRRLNIKVRTSGESRKGYKFSKKVLEKRSRTRWIADNERKGLNLDIIENLYVNKKKSAQDIADIYKVDIATILIRLEMRGIKRRKPIEYFKILMQNPKFIEKIFKGRKLRPNKPETFLDNLIKENNLPFHYVGSGEVIIGGRCPDFICNPSKKVILLHGDYWHYLKPKKLNSLLTREQVEKQDKLHYKNYFFDCLILWEHELKNPILVINKIKNFINH